MTEPVPLVSYEDMLEAGMHFGRKRTVFNPRMKDYVFTVRDGICIIDLLKTQEAIVSAVEFLNTTLQAGGLVLWVAPTKQSADGIKALAEKTQMPYVLDRWLGGTLTNFKNINSRVKRLVEMEDDKAAGRWEKYTKKEQLEMSREMEDMKKKFDGLKKLSRIPDIVFVASLKEGALAVHEALATGAKVVALANTDADPDRIARIIPCNDRSKKSVDLVLDAIRDNLKMNPA